MKKLFLSSIILLASISFGLETWNGLNGDYRVTTELDDGSDESGYWFNYDDVSNGGSSTITWPVPTGNAYDESALDPIIDECGGLCGTVSLGAGYDYPFAGIGFNLAGPDQTGVDITAWEGICVNYTASGIAPILELGPEDEATLTDYNNYATTLSISATSTNIPWSKFKQESGWGNKVEQSEYLKIVAAIKFKFSGKAGTSGEFNIQSVGEYGKCDASTPLPTAIQKDTHRDGFTFTNNIVSMSNPTKISVFDMAGKLVHESTSKTLDMNSFIPGMYMVKTNTTHKIMVK